MRTHWARRLRIAGAAAASCLALAAAGCGGSTRSPAGGTQAPTSTAQVPQRLGPTASPVEIALAYLKAVAAGDATAACAAARLPDGCSIGGPLDPGVQATARDCATLPPIKGHRDMDILAKTNGLQPADLTSRRYLLYGTGIIYTKNGGVAFDQAAYDVDCMNGGTIAIRLVRDPAGGYKIKSVDAGAGG